ncbi:polyketide antibiotic transporter [Mycolicibacterium gadium]|uniref:Exporter of polyketide antibiotics n=1 Tax=Mycolicibacterium gadium TaxID=1794 RepID=A0A7I7WJ03_MYCGU|nr:polyketide antibiotic transporter [Mycolicibacterium gadium]BBZ17120.1 exporter of polyketide antibiotics [Mycolicibacterium gadium]
MTTTLAVRRARIHRAPAGRAIIGLAIRQVRRGTLLVGGVCAGMSAVVAIQYQTTFSSEINEGALRALAENPAIRVLFGTPLALDDPGGFTVWRTGTPVLMLAGVWIMLTAVRVTRGEEDTGRWDLLLSGRIRRADVLLRYQLVLAGAALTIACGVGVGMAVAGTDAHGAIIYAAALFGATMTFAGLGFLSGQMMPSRSSAAGLAAGLLGSALLVRMLADGVSTLAWSAWISPLGLIARAAPYAENRIAPLLVLAGYAVVLMVGAVAAACHRDLGAGLVTVSAQRSGRVGLLGSLTGFAARRALRPTAGWAAAIGTYFVIVGALIASMLDFFEANPRFAELAAAAGFAGLNTAEGFVAALFSLMTIATGLFAVARLAAFVNHETARLWTMSFASPCSRERLLGTEIAVTAVGLALLHLVAAAAVWSGAALTGAPLRIGDALAGALNTAPVAWLALGAAALAVGWLPSAVGAVGALPVVGGFLLNVIAESMRAPAWVLNISPYVHIAAVPSASPEVLATITFLVVGGALTAVGIAGYRRRDLTS